MPPSPEVVRTVAEKILREGGVDGNGFFVLRVWVCWS